MKEKVATLEDLATLDNSVTGRVASFLLISLKRWMKLNAKFRN